VRKVRVTGTDGMCFSIPVLLLAYMKSRSEHAVRSAIKNGHKFCGYRIDWLESA
jgi:hypothetical protein